MLLIKGPDSASRMGHPTPDGFVVEDPVSQLPDVMEPARQYSTGLVREGSGKKARPEEALSGRRTGWRADFVLAIEQIRPETEIQSGNHLVVSWHCSSGSLKLGDGLTYLSLSLSLNDHIRILEPHCPLPGRDCAVQHIAQSHFQKAEARIQSGSELQVPHVASEKLPVLLGGVGPVALEASIREFGPDLGKVCTGHDRLAMLALTTERR